MKTLNEMLIGIEMELTKINSISENLTKIKVSFDFFRVSDVPNRKLRVRSCTYNIYFRKELGVRLLEHVR